MVAHQNQYHPIRDYLNCLEWDGIERIRFALHHFLGAEISEYTYEVMKLFLLGAISRVFRPGCKLELMLCLVGGQDAGKSSFFRLLACKDEWFSDDMKRIDDENVFCKMQGHWIIEMSEMIVTANAKSIKDIKSFLSREKETYKGPYATEPEDRLRQCVFGGTSWTSFRLIAAVIDGFYLSWCIRKTQRFILWKMKKHPDNICTNCRQRP